MTQYSMKQGIKLFGDKALSAIRKEMKQLHTREVLKPRRKSKLSAVAKDRMLEYIMTIKEKNDKTVKGRGCADGRPQRAWIPKEEATFPTPAPESVYLSCGIDAKEERDVATLDIPGMFLQTPAKPGTLWIVLRGEMLQQFLEVAPAAKPFVESEKGRPVLYCECDKALYGSLDSGRLSYLKLSKFLSDLGFQPNPFEPCWFNKDVNGKQLSVIFHVDDLKISHAEPSVVDEFIRQVDHEYGKEAPLTIMRGKIHVYLGFTIDYSIPGEVSFTMVEFLQKMLNDFPDSNPKFEFATPAAASLFTVDAESPALEPQQAQLFYTLTAKALFASKRC